MPSLIRLYVDQPLHSGISMVLEEGQGHYLRQVMRREQGGRVELFNGREGAFMATLTVVTKKLVQVEIGEQTAQPDQGPEVVLYFAPIKRTPLEFMAQKATELGVRTLVPVRTGRTVVKTINRDRLTSIMVEAAEQCERVSLVALADEHSLEEMLAALEHPVYFADEAGDDPDQQWGGPDGRAEALWRVLQENPPRQDQKTGILIGPEGGFTPEERKRIRAHTMIIPVSLGSRVLRADTAALAALALVQAALET